MHDHLGAGSQAVKDALRARRAGDRERELHETSRAIDHLGDHLVGLRAVVDGKAAPYNRQPRRAVR